MMKKKFYRYSWGINPRSIFFIPSVVLTDWRQNTWNSHTRSLIFAWFHWFYQIDMVQINRELDTQIDNRLTDDISDILQTENLFISDIDQLISYLNNNRGFVLLAKNSPTDHPYLKTVILNVLRVQPFVRKLGDIVNE